MSAFEPTGITRLLADWRAGDKSAFDRLVPFVHSELHRLASRDMSGERTGHVLQTTALINEAWLRLSDERTDAWQNRSHFFAIAAQTMRQILVDYARRQQRAKRGGKAPSVSLEDVSVAAVQPSEEILELDRALDELAAIDQRKAQVVEMRFFGGMSVEETAEVLAVSPNTVIRDWALARAWLRRALESQEPAQSAADV